MLRAHGLTLYEPGDVYSGMVSPEFADLRQIATWAVDFLNTPNERLGRRGPVCPYTRLSMDHNAFLLAYAGGERDVRSIESTVDQYRRWFMELLEKFQGAREHLLTILVVLPDFDRTDPGPLDANDPRLPHARRHADGPQAGARILAVRRAGAGGAAVAIVARRGRGGPSGRRRIRRVVAGCRQRDGRSRRRAGEESRLSGAPSSAQSPVEGASRRRRSRSRPRCRAQLRRRARWRPRARGSTVAGSA